MKYLIPVLILLISCNPSRKLDKLNAKHPELLAKFCIDTFPCVTTKIDTVTRVEYDFIEVQCPGIDNVKNDTFWITNTKTIKGPGVIVTQQQYNTITKIIKDSAAIKSCELSVLELNKKLAEINEKNRKLENKVNTKNRWIMWLIIALLVTIMGNIIQFKKW